MKIQLALISLSLGIFIPKLLHSKSPLKDIGRLWVSDLSRKWQIAMKGVHLSRSIGSFMRVMIP